MPRGLTTTLELDLNRIRARPIRLGELICQFLGHGFRVRVQSPTVDGVRAAFEGQAPFAALCVDVDGTLPRDVLAELVANGGEPAVIAESMGFEAMDTGELDGLLDQLIADNPDEWGRFKEGDKKVQGFFVGQIMKATQGKADGKVVNQLMQQRANS